MMCTTDVIILTIAQTCGGDPLMLGWGISTL